MVTNKRTHYKYLPNTSRGPLLSPLELCPSRTNIGVDGKTVYVCFGLVYLNKTQGYSVSNWILCFPIHKCFLTLSLDNGVETVSDVRHLSPVGGPFLLTRWSRCTNIPGGPVSVTVPGNYSSVFVVSTEKGSVCTLWWTGLPWSSFISSQIFSPPTPLTLDTLGVGHSQGSVNIFSPLHKSSVKPGGTSDLSGHTDCGKILWRKWLTRKVISHNNHRSNNSNDQSRISK